MTPIGWTQILVFLAMVLLSAPALGSFLHRVYEGQAHPLTRPLGWLERLVYGACKVDRREQPWQHYAGSLLLFSAASLLVTYLFQRLQHLLPLNPQGLGPVEPLSAFNTAASFASNTNWQGYAGEATMSSLTQMAGLAWQNFVSAAAGLAVAVALARGLTRRADGGAPPTIGNFWVDLTRGTVYVLLPASLVIALVLVSQGAVQSLAPSQRIATLDGGQQLIPLGPVASQEAIKQLGTNGGGFFNANAAHPFENPTPLTNLVSMLLIFAIPGGLAWTFGRMTGDRRHGAVLLAAMSILFLAGVTALYWAEADGNPALGLDSAAGNLEGKEVRFGVAASALYATVTTDASCGAVNAMHDSLTPIGGLVTLFNIQLGEVIFGGVGAGLYGILVMAILAVFIAGLMVGRTPELLGKKVESREVKLAMLFVLVPTLLTLSGAALSVVMPAALSSLGNAGPHGLTEILYAFSSAAGNNGSAFAGLAADTRWFNVALGLAMLIGRFWQMILVLAIAGLMAAKKVAPPSAGTLPTTGPLFLALLLGVIVIVGALTFLPALSLGPVVEHFLAASGRVFPT